MIYISIIIPVFNREKYLITCLESIIFDKLNKKYYELILINDGSTDESKNIIEKFQNKYPQLITVINKENTGVGDSRNIGIKKARGKYIMFVDSDDYIKFNSLNTLFSFLLTNKDVYIFGNPTKRLKNKNDRYLQLLEILTLYSGSVEKIFKRKFLIKNNLYFDTNLKLAEDYYWLINIFSKTDNIFISEFCFYNINYSKNSLSRTYDKRIFDVLNGFYIHTNSLKDNINYYTVIKLSFFVHFCFTVGRYEKISKEHKKLYQDELTNFRNEIFKLISLKTKYFQVLRKRDKFRYILFKYNLNKIYKFIYYLKLIRKE